MVLGRYTETGQPTPSGLGSGRPTLQHQWVPGQVPVLTGKAQVLSWRKKPSEGNGNAVVGRHEGSCYHSHPCHSDELYPTVASRRPASTGPLTYVTAGLSIIRPVRPRGHPERSGVNQAERSEDYSLPG